MTWTRCRIAAAVMLYAVYVQQLYQYLLTPTLPLLDHKRPMNLVPFRTIHTYLVDTGTPLEHRAYELAGNLLVFAPVALLLALILRRFRIAPILLVSAGLSLAVETLQYALGTWRSADIDDVICNVSGAVVSYVLIAAILHFSRPDRFPFLRRRPTMSDIEPTATETGSSESDPVAPSGHAFQR
ncbi:MAG: VanZ family protein [Acidothermus sp.]|nr:VanZ family protein [Acidothermus sp.]MCL6537311.1 VanZ family protein [Acidothermus sp.]